MVTYASFSIWAYLCSVSVIVLDAYATGFQLELSSCSRTAPSPYDEASADTFVEAWWLYRANIVGFDNSSLRLVKACSWAAPHIYAVFLLSIIEGVQRFRLACSKTSPVGSPFPSAVLALRYWLVVSFHELPLFCLGLLGSHSGR